MIKTFQDAFGNINLRLEYNAEFNWVHADFIGIQSFMSIQKGMNAVLEMFVTYRCTKYLSDNTNIVGGFTESSAWLQDVWTPLAMQEGMKHVAHVLAPGLFGRYSMEGLVPNLPPELDIQLFESLADAKDWLAQV